MRLRLPTVCCWQCQRQRVTLTVMLITVWHVYCHKVCQLVSLASRWHQLIVIIHNILICLRFNLYYYILLHLLINRNLCLSNLFGKRAHRVWHLNSSFGFISGFCWFSWLSCQQVHTMNKEEKFSTERNNWLLYDTVPVDGVSQNVCILIVTLSSVQLLNVQPFQFFTYEQQMFSTWVVLLENTTRSCVKFDVKEARIPGLKHCGNSALLAHCCDVLCGHWIISFCRVMVELFVFVQGLKSLPVKKQSDARKDCMKQLEKW